MKISNVNSNIVDFFKRNGKKWACTAVTALMLTTPAIAKSEKKKDDNKPVTTIEQTIDSKITENNELINLDLIAKSLTGDLSNDINISDKMPETIDKELIENIITGMPLKMTTPWKLVNGEKNEYTRKIIIFKLKDNAIDLLVDNYENIVKCIKENSITEKLAEDFFEIQDVQEEQKVFEKVSKDNNKSQLFDVEINNKTFHLQCCVGDIFAFGAILLIVIIFLIFNKIITGRFFK